MRSALLTFGPLAIVIGFVLLRGYRDRRLRTTVPWVIVGTAVLVGWWYLLQRFPNLVTHQPIVIPETLHLALSIALLVFAFCLLGVTLYYRFVRKAPIPRYVRGSLWVLILGGLSATLLFRY